MKKSIGIVACFLVQGVWAAVPQSLIHRSSAIDLIVEESSTRITLNYTLPEMDTEVSGEFTTLSLDGTPKISTTGSPQLPYIPIKVVVPAMKEIDSLEVIISQKDTVSLQYPVKPAPRYGIPSELSRLSGFEQSEAYSYKVWPEETVVQNGIQMKQGNAIASFKLFPIQYEPEKQLLVQARDISVTVHLKDKPLSRSSKTSVMAVRKLSQQALATENSAVATSQSRAAGSAQYLVITVDSLASYSGENSLDTLLAYHHSQGLTTKVLTTESIENRYAGVDLQEKIRNAIIDHYNSEGTEYVLLAGDTPLVPARLLHLDEAPSVFNKGVPSDLYYACLDGTFNSDGDEKWGERNDGIDGAHPDHLAEVHVGRFSVENTVELANIVGKTVTHLNETSAGDILLAGEHLGFGGVSEYAKPSLEELWEGGEANGYITRSFGAEPDLTKRTIYAEQFSDKKWRDISIIPLINENSIGIIDHIGHGFENVNLRLYTGRESLNEIKNSKPIFVFSQACLSGNFQKESISEYLTTGTPHGMWGGVWNSDNGLGAYESTDSPSQFMNRHFWHGYFGRDMKRVGELLSYMHEAAFDESVENWAFRWSSYITNLQGDPAAYFMLRGNDSRIAFDPIGDDNMWDQGHMFTLTWYDNIESALTLDLYRNGTFVKTIETSLNGTQEYQWTIDEGIETGNGYTLKLHSAEHGVSSVTEEFSIDTKSELTLTSPAEGDTLYKGASTEISWSDNLSESVSLVLLYKGELWDTIDTDIAGDINSYQWDIPLTVSHDTAYQIAVVSSEKEWLVAKNSGTVAICSPVEEQFPYSDDFESYAAGTEMGFWSQRSDDSFDWSVRKGATPSRAKADDWWNITGPASDASGSGNYIYCEATGHEGGKSAGLISAPFDIEGLVDGTLSFKVHMYCKEDNGNMGNLALYLLVDGESHRVINMTGSKGDKWILKEVDLSPYKGAKRMQAYFKMRTGKSFASDIAIDEFSIECTKEAVAVTSPKSKRKSGLAIAPQIVTTESAVQVQIPGAVHGTTVDYSLFDVVGNRVAVGQFVPLSGTGEIPVPSSLASGSYLLVCKVKLEKTEIYTTILGKKE